MAEPFSDSRITYFGVTDTRNKRVPFGIKSEDRVRHLYVIGKTGMGKSTLLENMAIQDIQNGEGMAFIDPHGKSAEELLDFVPEHRIKDVVYFAPFDMENPVAFNIMEDIGPDKRHLVVAGLMSTFKKIWVDAWSARMEYILQNTLLALLEYPGATLLGVNKMLSEKEYRKKVVENIKDPATKSFWVDEFAKYTERFAAEAVPAIQNKVGQFTSNPLIRNIIGQPKSSFDLRKIMDERKILIVNLSKGLVGEGNAALLGGMLITKIYLAALSRADATQAVMKKLPNFYLHVDEFQSFANESFADILSEARKYKLNLTMAHQYIEQMAEEVQAAVFGNVGTMITFRVGAFDAEVLEKEFAPQFTAEDLVNLGIYQIYLKLMIDGVSSSPFSAVTMPPIGKPPMSFKDGVIANSRISFGRERAVAEKDIEKQLLGDGQGGGVSPQKESKPPTSFAPAAEARPFAPRTTSSFQEKKSESKSVEGLRSALASVITSEKLPPVTGQKPPTPQPSAVQPSATVQPAKSQPGPHKPQLQERFDRRDQKPQNRQPQRPEDGKSLKEALSELLNKETKFQEKKVPTPTHQPQEKQTTPPQEKKEPIPNEIPEEKLREMLKVKEE